MTSENPVKSTGNFERNKPGSGEQQDQNTVHDLNSPLSSAKNDDLRQSSSIISQSSPSKRSGCDTSPTKGKNRRKNDARKRNANNKKHNYATDDQSEKQNLQQSTNTPNQSPHKSTSKNAKSDNNLIESKNANNLQAILQEPSAAGPEKGNINSSSEPRREKHLDLIRSKECKDMRDQLKAQDVKIRTLVDQINQQLNKIKELDSALLSTTKACNQLEKLLQQELTSRTRLECENESLIQTVSRLKTQLNAHEKNKSANDELIRVLNATLMERETEVSILKLKMTRMQTNPSSNIALNSSNRSLVRDDPRQIYVTTGRSNSEFDRNSHIRSSLIANSSNVIASTSQLSRDPRERDASVWATVPEELTPSRRPQMLERNFEPIYRDPQFKPHSNIHSLTSSNNQTSTPILRDRRYKTLPIHRSMKSPTQKSSVDADKVDAGDLSIPNLEPSQEQVQVPPHYQVTNLDDSNSTSHSSGNRNFNESKRRNDANDKNKALKFQEGPSSDKSNLLQERSNPNKNSSLCNTADSSHYCIIEKPVTPTDAKVEPKSEAKLNDSPPKLPDRTPSTPVKLSSGFKKIFDKFRRSDSSSNSQSRTHLEELPPTPVAVPLKRGANRSTLVGMPKNIRAQMSPMRQAMNFQTDQPFSEWDTEMLVDWLTMIGLSMYTTQCRLWVECGAHIMNATPAEVDKGLGITNHIHRKKLRLAISELNGDCDKITKAAAKLDYLWVARWLDDIGLPQHKEAFINARVDGRVLNYLTVEDLVSMGVKSILHHASIRCGIRVLRLINFDLQLLKRRASSDEVEQMNAIRQKMNQVSDESGNLAYKPQAAETTSDGEADIPLWTCHRLMEWLRLIDFAEFAPNLRGSGVHGGLIVFEDGFNFDTMCSILSIPIERTLLRRHLATFFKELIGKDLAHRKRQHQDVSSNQQLNPLAEIKTPKKSQFWFTKMKSFKVGQDGMEEYLCPMYPVDPPIMKNKSYKVETSSSREENHLSKIPESINV